MSDEKNSQEAENSESPEESQKSEVGKPVPTLTDPRSEEENNSASGISKSEIEHPTSETGPLPTASLKLPTEQMEVHHHPQLEHKPKPWKEYLFEGLMIFLAVTMGFFAESYREKLSEGAKEREYIRSMISDLQKDIANYNRVIERGNNTPRDLDSLILLLNSPKRDQYGSELYYLARMSVLKFIRFRVTDRVFNEMKSSGNLRLINNKAIADSITVYYYYLETWTTNNTIIDQLVLSYYNSVGKVFDVSVFQKLIKDSNFKYPDVHVPRPAGNPALASTSKADINELVGKAHFLFTRIRIVFRDAPADLARATCLIKLLKKEYNLENE